MPLLWTITLAITAVAAWTDLRKGEISNLLTGFAFVAGLVGHAALGAAEGGVRGGAVAVAWSLAGAIACAAPVLPLFVRGALGGGDLKLFAALGALVHPMEGLELEIHALVVAALVAVGQMVHRGVLMATLGRTLRVAFGTIRRRKVSSSDGSKAADVPPQLLTWFRLGPSIFAGTVLTWLLRGR